MGFILSPYETEKCSILLKRTGVKISYIIDQENILKKMYKKKKPPMWTKPHKGLFRKDKQGIANKNICQAKKWKI